jgi:hypothetical protein
MGEANNRGTYEQRRAAACVEEAEVLICLKMVDGRVNVQFIPRDEIPDNDSPAVSFGGFLLANCEALLRKSAEVRRQHLAQQAANEGDPRIITDRQPRSITDEAGNVIRSTDDVNLRVFQNIADAQIGEPPAPWPFPKVDLMQSGGGGEFDGGGASASYDASQQDYKYEPPDAAPSSSEPGDSGSGE